MISSRGYETVNARDTGPRLRTAIRLEMCALNGVMYRSLDRFSMKVVCASPPDQRSVFDAVRSSAEGKLACQSHVLATADKRLSIVQSDDPGISRRRQQVNVDISRSASPATMPQFDEMQHVLIRGHIRTGQVAKESQYGLALPQIAKRQFSDDEGMHQQRDRNRADPQSSCRQPADAGPGPRYRPGSLWLQ